MDLRNIGTIKQAVDTFGEQSQVIVAIEELSELQKELCKLLRGQYDIHTVSEEIADVEIMVEQMKTMFDNHDCVESWIARKLHRLRKRIDRFSGEKSPDVLFCEPLPPDYLLKSDRIDAGRRP